MALNLQTLTDSSTSAGILTDLAKSASNLDLVASLENRVSGGANATQTTATYQPRAHVPVGDGHLYIPNVSGNYAEGPSVTIGANETWEGELDMVVTQWGSYIRPMGGVTGSWTSGFGLIFYPNGLVRCFSGSVATNSAPSGVTLGTQFNVKYGYDGSDLYVNINDVRIATYTASFPAINETLQLAQQNTLTTGGEFSIQKAKLTVGSSVVFDCDFSASNIGHGDTSFQAAVGGTVTINKSGNDPATIVRRNFLRFDGADNFMSGLFNQTLSSGGYMFAAFSVNYGSETYARVFAVNSTNPDEPDYNNPRSLAFSIRQTTTDDVGWFYNNSFQDGHTGTYDEDRGVVLHELKAIDGEQVSNVNNADAKTKSLDLSGLSSEKFTIGGRYDGNGNASIDLEALYLFDHTLTDGDANKIRDYLNDKSSIY